MKHRKVVGFGVFCLFAGSRWFVENAYPSGLPPLLLQAVHLGVVGVAALAFCLPRRSTLSQAWLSISFAGLLLLGLPAVLNEVAGSAVSHAGAALFTLLPLFVAVGAAAMYPESGDRAMMLPALAGSAGGLLLLPFELPSTGYGGLMLGVVLLGVLLTAGASLWMHRLLQGVGMMPAVAVVCAANCVVLGAAGLGFKGIPKGVSGVGGELLRALLLDLPMDLLLVWLLREMPPVSLSTRYLLVPLVTIVEGMVLFRPPVDAQMVLGITLLSGGGGMLLSWKAAREEDEPTRLGL